MGEFILNGRNYGGSIITPNPSDTPTDTLDSVKIGDTTYEIQGGGGGGSSLIIDAQRYSLEEQVVGIWTDGKPLYQRTWEFSSSVTLSANTWFTTSIPNTGMEKIINVEAMSETGTRWAVSGACDEGSYVNLICFRNRTITVKYVTVRYTKTTDVAGSGGYQAYGFSPIVCSEAEREVGVWEDNKPLYQKTFIGTFGGTAGSDVSNYKMADLSNIDTIASISGTLQGITPINSYYASDNYNMVFVNGAKNGLYCNGKNIGGNTYKVTIQYTKTTDVAGSSDYNTLAIPNVHYSTDEQVIGTWIDGKTLYQKTKVISFSELTHQGNLYYTQFRETGENVVDVKAKAVSTSYGMCYLGCKNYTMNNEESYWELIMYYNNICLKFTGTTATNTNVSTITVTYQYTKTT